MTEAEWLDSNDLEAMLRFLQERETGKPRGRYFVGWSPAR